MSMNFTPTLSAFQGTILAADNVHQFARLSARGGNEDQINYVISGMKNFLEKNNFLSDDKILNLPEMRRFALYIILNADLPELEQLVESAAISAIIWTTPTIPKCLMCEMMWNLHMDQFTFEIISFTHPQLAIEVAGAFLDNFKYFNPLECLEQLKLLSTACYLLICRLHLFNFQNPEIIQKSTMALDVFHKYLKYYTTPPNNYKLNTLSKIQLYKYQGKSLYSMLQLIDESITIYTTQLNPNTPEDDFYKLTYAEGILKNDPPQFIVCESTHHLLNECLKNANMIMLDTCKVLVMDVSVDVFCCWSELQEGGVSMQQTVGELCYKVHNKLLNLNMQPQHPVVNMLEQIARKPIEIKDTINATDEDVISSNVNNNNGESKVWIKALIYRENLCQNQKLLNIVASNLDVYDKEESFILFSNLKRYATTEVENRDYIEALCVKVFQNCDVNKKMLLLEEHFSDKILFDMKETKEFERDMTTIFNKLIDSSDADFTDVLKLFLQSPQKVYAKVFGLSCENAQQIEIMLKVMNLFEKFSDHYYSTDTAPCLIRICQDRIDKGFETNMKETHFVKFICGLRNANIITGTKLLLLIVMTNLHKALLNKEILDLKVQIKLLKEAYNLDELIAYRAPLLAMLAQVVDAVRWKIHTFSTAAAVVLDVTLDLLIYILATYNKVIPDKESKWLKSKLITLQPLNMYYYRILYNPPGSNYLEIVSAMKIQKDMNLDELTLWLGQVVCVCTRQEWCDLYECLSIFGGPKALRILHDAIAKLYLAEKLDRSENSWACIFYVYRLYIYVIRFKYFKDPINEVQAKIALSRVASLTDLMKDENIEQLGTGLVPLFAFLTEKRNTHPFNLIRCLYECFGSTKLWPKINAMFGDKD